MALYHVKPLPIFEHLTPFVLVGYNGYGKPMAMIANPEDIWFIHDKHHPPSASVWIVPGALGE